MLRRMGWPGRAPAPPVTEAGSGQRRQGARHVSAIQQLRNRRDRICSNLKPPRPNSTGVRTNFGKMVKLQEAENQIVIDFEVYDRRPNDSDLLIPAIELHQAAIGRVPHLVAADAAFYSGKNEAAAKAKGVKHVCVPNRSTKSAERRRERWFRHGQKWRTGCEGCISVSKRRHGLNRCRYKGEDGMKRWVGLGVISDNLINIGRANCPSKRPR
jgi:IS5 family transposase